MLWIKVLDQIKLSFRETVKGIGFTQDEDEKDNNIVASSFFRDGTVELKELLSLFESIDKDLLIILDEFDRLHSNFDLTYFTDTIKAISDNYKNITVIIVGVAENIHDIIGEHQSIQRNLVQIHLPIMNRAELYEIIEKGEEVLEVKVEAAVKEYIVDYSDGYPHYTHLLCFHAFSSAISKNKRRVEIDEFNIAIKESINEAHEILRNDYQKATLSTKKNIFKDVLWACAQVNLDDNHSFQALDIQNKLSIILAKEMKVNQFGYHLGQLCSIDRGAILKSIGTRNRKRYKFRNPLMRPFIKMIIYENQQSL